MDDVFLKLYFAKHIEVPELQHEVKKILKGSPDSYMTILDLIHADFNVQNTNDAMRDDTKPFSVSRRAANPKVEAKKVTTILKKRAILFPNNNGTLLLSHFYNQFKD